MCGYLHYCYYRLPLKAFASLTIIIWRIIKCLGSLCWVSWTIPCHLLLTLFYFKFPRLRPLFLLIRSARTGRWMSILWEESRITRQKADPVPLGPQQASHRINQNHYVKWLCFEVILFWSSVKWVTVKFLGAKVPRTLGWPYTEGTLFYCDYFIWCITCAVVVLTCVMCGWVYVRVFWQYVYLYLLCFVLIVLCFILFRLCTFIRTYFIRTRVGTTATEWKFIIMFMTV